MSSDQMGPGLHECLESGWPRRTNVLWLSTAQIERTARMRGPRQHIAGIVLRQAMGELGLRFEKGIVFRRSSNSEAVRAYCRMQPEEFETINSRQAWANWRTIPRSLSGRLPDRAVQVIDLCSGCGESTAVLAYYCASGSQVLGLEYNSRFVALASSRRYWHRDGGFADVRFRTQSVLETFRDEQDRIVPDRSIELVNATGAIGCHFDAPATRTIAAEVARVLQPGGWAMIDSGPTGTKAAMLIRIFTRCGFELVGSARSSVFDRHRQYCLRRVI